MSKTILKFGSVTYAMKARKILQRSKIPCEIVKLNVGDGKGGCTYGIKFNSDKLYGAVMELKNNEIDYEVYSEKNRL